MRDFNLRDALRQLYANYGTVNAIEIKRDRWTPIGVVVGQLVLGGAKPGVVIKLTVNADPL